MAHASPRPGRSPSSLGSSSMSVGRRRNGAGPRTSRKSSGQTRAPTRDELLPSTNAETALLHRIQGGEPEALRLVTERLAPSALALAMTIVDDPALAEKVVEEAFGDAWRRCNRLGSQFAGIRPWILGIVHRKAADVVQSVSGREISLENLLPAESSERAESTHASERQARVAEALQALTPARRQALMLAYFGGLTCRQIADRLHIREKTARARLRDGLSTLREALVRDGFNRTAGRVVSEWELSERRYHASRLRR